MTSQYFECPYKEKHPVSSQKHSFLHLNTFSSRQKFILFHWWMKPQSKHSISVAWKLKEWKITGRFHGGETQKHDHIGLERADNAQHQVNSCLLHFTLSSSWDRCAVGGWWHRVLCQIYSLCRVHGCSCSMCSPWCSSSIHPFPSIPPPGLLTPVTSPPGSCSCSLQMQGPLYPEF